MILLNQEDFIWEIHNISGKIYNTLIKLTLKTHRQIWKERCLKKYCLCDKTCQLSVFLGTPWRSCLEKLSNNDKYITNKFDFLYIDESLKCVEKKKLHFFKYKLRFTPLWNSCLILLFKKCVLETEKY